MNLYGHAPRQKTKCELNMTPMIDCIFQLLIFFMCGMKFREIDRRLEADLPKAGALDKTTELKSEIWIFIKVREGTESKPQEKIIIDQQVMRDWKQVYQTLYRLSQIPGARKDPVILAPDNEALQGWVMTILDYLNRLHFQSINFKQ